MRVQFERFTEAHIAEAVQLAVSELEAERKHCHDLPRFEFEERFKQILWWLSNQNFGGKAAFCDGKLVGYLLFAGPWDGMFGNVKGVFSPLGGSAFSYDYENRGKLASMLFTAVAQELADAGIYSCALSRYAHDEEVAKSFVWNGFGIRCMDAVRDMEAVEKQFLSGGTLCSQMNTQKLQQTENQRDAKNAYGEIQFEELSREQFGEVAHLQRGLHRHLLNAPVFFPVPDCGFEAWFAEWIKRETMRIFAARAEGRVIGFISVDEEGENFITEYEGMKNICGAYLEEAYRGSGIAQGLLAFICETLKAEGVTHVGVDCETMNPTALRFWDKYFTPYTYSFARRFDERV